MNHKILAKSHKQEVTSLFTSVLTLSGGEKEGRLIGTLASELSSTLAHMKKSQSLQQFFSRLRFNEPIRVYMLAPVAVSTQHQGKGIGQALINYPRKIT